MPLVEQINKLKKEKNAVILVHNYQRPEIYEVADKLGDSLDLARAAVASDAKTIVFCGVDFMAESAKILNPEKKVLIPTLTAKCPLAAMANASALREKKKEHPNAAVVSYINTSAEVKAECTVCCTSANAVDVVESLPHEEIIFVPDTHLASWVERQTSKKMVKWDGFCRTHAVISPKSIQKAIELHSQAKVIAHPECPLEVLDLADKVCGTQGMITYSQESPAQEFIIATEEGMLNRLYREVPGKQFYTVAGSCTGMKTTTLEKVLEALEKEQFEITLEEQTRLKAKEALDRMLEIR